MAGEIDLSIARMGGNQKAARGVHLANMPRYLDVQHQKAVVENDKSQEPGSRKAS